MRTLIFFFYTLSIGAFLSALVIWLFGSFLIPIPLKFFTISPKEVGIGIGYSLAAAFLYLNRDNIDLGD